MSDMFKFDLQCFAESDIVASDPNLRQMIWSADLWTSAKKQLYFAKFIGKTAEFIIQEKTELTKAAGDQITVPLIPRLIAPGVSGDEVLSGNEEPMQAFDFAVTVDQMAKSVRLKGSMAQQKTQYSLRSAAKTVLSQWMQEYMDQYTFTALTTSYTPNRVVYPAGRSAENAIVAGDILTLAEISKAKRKATLAGQPYAISTSGGTVSATQGGFVLTGSSTAFNTDFAVGDLITVGTQANYVVSITSATVLNVAAAWGTTFSGSSYSAIRYNGARSKLRPVMVNGQPFFVCVIHPYQERDLRNDPDWIGAQQSFAAWRGYDNPIYKGGIGLYDGVIIHTHENVVLSATGSGSTPTQVGHGLLMGAQAGVMAIAQEPTWVEDPSYDYQRKPGFATSLIWGVKKSVFNGEDFAVVQVLSSAVAE